MYYCHRIFNKICYAQTHKRTNAQTHKRSGFFKPMLIAALATLTLTVNSCQEDTVEETDSQQQIVSPALNIASAKLSDQIAYKQHHLQNLAAWSANQFTTTELVGMHEELLEMYGGEGDVVYVEDLYELFKSRTGTELPEIKESLNAFKNIGDESWLPIFRFTNRTVTHSNNRLNSSDPQTSTYSEPNQLIIAIEDNSEIAQIYSPFLPGEDDDLIPYEGEFTESAIGNTPLLVFELDPCGSNTFISAFFDSPCDGDSFSGGLGGGGLGGGSGSRALLLNKMKIKDLKEAFPGRSEVEFKGYKLTVSNITPNITIDCGDAIHSSSNCYEYNGGKRIAQVYRRHKGDNRTYDWKIASDEGFYNEVLVYVIFESDNFPAPKKSSYLPLPNNSYSLIEYRSYESDFDKQVLSQNNAFGYPSVYGFAHSNRSIEYNLVSAY